MIKTVTHHYPSMGGFVSTVMIDGKQVYDGPVKVSRESARRAAIHDYLLILQRKGAQNAKP